MPMTAANSPSRFAAYLMSAALRAGYNLGPDGRDRGRFAEAIGMTAGNLTHILNGERIPATKFIRPTAAALGVNPLEVLAAADGHTDLTLRGVPTPIRTRYSPQVAAEELGIPEGDRDLFLAMVEQMLSKAA